MIPALLAGIAVGVAGLTKYQVSRQVKRHSGGIEEWALRTAFEKMGLPDLMDAEHITRQSFTDAINKGPLSHFQAWSGDKFQFTNIFSKAAVREDVERFALRMGARSLGLEVNDDARPTVKTLQKLLQKYVQDKVIEQLEAGGGDMIDNAKELAAVVKIIIAMRKKFEEQGGVGKISQRPPGKPLLMDRASISNRERQAKYRAAHRRVWVEKDHTGPVFDERPQLG